ncbi:MAG: hypothetical protein K1Y02_24785 [Candidatus Hydrogenedentes bacterium]|nr:hypothetical protein [Candidatus Hydrogenedentota bacterium]
MFCPNCRAEFREGFDTCSDCNVPLVEALPPEELPEYIDYTEVLSTYNPSDIAIVKSIMDTTDIPYVWDGDYFTTAEPLVTPARLMVQTERAAEAAEFLKDLSLSFSGIDVRDSLQVDSEEEEPESDNPESNERL